MLEALDKIQAAEKQNADLKDRLLAELAELKTENEQMLNQRQLDLQHQLTERLAQQEAHYQTELEQVQKQAAEKMADAQAGLQKNYEQIQKEAVAVILAKVRARYGS